MNAKQDEKLRIARAMAALDSMAATWAAAFDIRQAVKAMMLQPDGEDRFIAFIKQGHCEGLYIGRTSRKPLTDERIEDLRGDANRGYNIEREDYFKAFRDAESAHGITE